MITALETASDNLLQCQHCDACWHGHTTCEVPDLPREGAQHVQQREDDERDVALRRSVAWNISAMLELSLCLAKR